MSTSRRFRVSFLVDLKPIDVSCELEGPLDGAVVTTAVVRRAMEGGNPTLPYGPSIVPNGNDVPPEIVEVVAGGARGMNPLTIRLLQEAAAEAAYRGDELLSDLVCSNVGEPHRSHILTRMAEAVQARDELLAMLPPGAAPSSNPALAAAWNQYVERATWAKKKPRSRG